MSWQPIDTAPRGVTVLVVWDGAIVMAKRGLWDGRWQTNYACRFDEDQEPTHWMQLPDMPK